jgi:hypothetical protein
MVTKELRNAVGRPDMSVAAKQDKDDEGGGTRGR